MRKCLLFAILTIICNSIYSQSSSKEGLHLMVRQSVMPGPSPDLVYEIKHHSLRVVKIVEGNWFTVCHRRHLYSCRLSENFVDSLRLSIQEQDLMHLAVLTHHQ